MVKKTAWDGGKAFHGRVAENTQLVIDTFNFAAEYGEMIMKDNIETGGTGEHWRGNHDGRPHQRLTGRQESSPGRVASGAMLSAVGSWVSPSGKDNKARMGVGFTNSNKTPEYARFQERGGVQGSPPFLYVEGMFAIENAWVEVNDWINSQIRQGFKR